MPATLQIAFMLLGLFREYGPKGLQAVTDIEAVLNAARDEKREVTDAELKRLRAATEGEVTAWNEGR